MKMRLNLALVWNSGTPNTSGWWITVIEVDLHRPSQHSMDLMAAFWSLEMVDLLMRPTARRKWREGTKQLKIVGPGSQVCQSDPKANSHKFTSMGIFSFGGGLVYVLTSICDQLISEDCVYICICLNKK